MNEAKTANTLEGRSIQRDYITSEDIKSFGMEICNTSREPDQRKYHTYALGNERYQLYEHDRGLFEIVNFWRVPPKINAIGCRE